MLQLASCTTFSTPEGVDVESDLSRRAPEDDLDSWGNQCCGACLRMSGRDAIELIPFIPASD